MERKTTSATMITLLLASLFTVLPTFAAPPPKSGVFNPAADIQDPNSQMYLNQQWYRFTSPPLKAGTKFTVDVCSYNISKLYAYQIVIVYNASVINCTNAWPNNGWDDPDWVFTKYGTGASEFIDWYHNEDPGPPVPAGFNIECVGEVHKNIQNITLTGIEAVMARFEFEILVDPTSDVELVTILDLTNTFLGGTFYVWEGELNNRSPDLTNSYYVISEDTVVHYVWNQIVEITDSFNDGDPKYTEYSLSGEIDMTFSPPDINGVINLTVPKESLYTLPVYRPDFDTTVTFVPLTDWYGKLYTINYTGDVDIISMTNDTGIFFWKDGSWHPRGEEWIGDGIPDPAGSSWLVSNWNTTFYRGNGTDGPILSTYVSQLWLTTGFSENIIVEPASRLNGFYTNSTGVPFSPPFVGSIGTYVFTKATLNIEWEQGNLQDRQVKTDQLMISPPAFVTSLFSPANLYITDPLNRHIGTDPTTGLIVNEIDGAFYSGNGSHPQRIVIPDPLDGVYDIKIVGTGTGEYTSRVEFATDEKTTAHSYTGNISDGIIVEGQANVSEGEMTSTKPHLFGDLNFDEIINIFDVAIAAAAFGTWPGKPRWNPIADVVEPWDIINIFDVAAVASQFGKHI